MTRILGRLVIVLAVVAALAVSVGLWYRQRLNAPHRGFVADELFVDVPVGASVAGIATRLEAAGVIPDAWTFRLAARLSGADRQMKAGEYRFADPASPAAVMARLVAGDVFTRAVTFPEGLTIAEMGDLFAKSGFGGAEAFRQAAGDVSLVSAWDPQARSLEGYLFPDTYAWPRRVTAPDAVRAMVARFGRALDGGLRADAEARHLSIRDVLTLASLIEKETGRAGERPLVSAVYHNRLKAGMPLQCDPTVIYALMLAGRWNGNLRRVDLAIRSPYNTYVVRGLPPGPIASPGRASIDAAIHPADAPFLYFVSRNDGTHAFAATLAEHNRNVARYQKRR